MNVRLLGFAINYKFLISIAFRVSYVCLVNMISMTISVAVLDCLLVVIDITKRHAERCCLFVGHFLRRAQH